MKRFVLLLAILALFLTACPAVDTGGPKPQPSQTVTQLGSVFLNDFSAPGYPASTNATASFNNVVAIQAGELQENPLEPYLDTCFVTQDPNESPPFLSFMPNVALGESLDAGETITIRSGSETFSTLRREGQGEEAFYLQDNAEVPPELPDGKLTADVPGADFPAYSASSFPNIPSVVLTAPEEPTGITPETVFSWQAVTSAEAGSAVLLSALQISETEPNAFIGVICVATDDGSFAFPAATKVEFDQAGFSEGVLLEASRFASRLEFSGNSALYLQLFRQTGFGAAGF